LGATAAAWADLLWAYGITDEHEALDTFVHRKVQALKPLLDTCIVVRALKRECVQSSLHSLIHSVHHDATPPTKLNGPITTQSTFAVQRRTQVTMSGLFGVASYFANCGTLAVNRVISTSALTSMTSAARGPVHVCPIQAVKNKLHTAGRPCRLPKPSSSPPRLQPLCTHIIQTLSLLSYSSARCRDVIIRSSLSPPPFSEARILTIELPAATALLYYLLLRRLARSFLPQTFSALSAQRRYLVY
jgi:hypothetical protein